MDGGLRKPIHVPPGGVPPRSAIACALEQKGYGKTLRNGAVLRIWDHYAIFGLSKR